MALAATSSTARLGRQAFDRLERWLYGRKTSSLSLHDIEVEEEHQGREVLRLLLQAHLDERGDGDVGQNFPVRDPETGQVVLYTHKRLHTRRVVALFGEVSVTRMGYGRRGEASVHPLDAVLKLPARTWSYEIQRRLVKAAVKGPFDEALEVVSEATGVVVHKRTVEQLVIDASVDFESFYALRSEPPRQKRGPILVASVDSKGIPMVKAYLAEKKVRQGRGEKRQKKRMATVAAVFTQEPHMRTPQEVVQSLFCETSLPRRKRISRPQHKRVWASLVADKDAFLGDVKEEMQRRDPRHRKTWVVVTDGERGLQRRVCAAMDGDFVFVLDLLHVTEKLWAASYVFHPEGSVKARQFVQERVLRILRGQVSQVVKGLRQMVTKRRLRGKARKTLLAVAGYYYRNRSRMRYDDYLKRGLPIASGSVEGACKNLVKARMERSGMRWTPTMAEAILQLRATYLSGDFEDYWAYHVRQEQARLYPYAWETTVVGE